ncbi:MAG: methylmalonyl-CoA mutase [Chloroflexi bacterium]|nr:methylmalonyl-CoA mutase [Chloroflexota bacterium]
MQRLAGTEACNTNANNLFSDNLIERDFESGNPEISLGTFRIMKSDTRLRSDGMYDEKEIEVIRKAYAKWQAEKVPGGKEEGYVSDSGIPCKAVYTPADVHDSGLDYLKDLGFPGDYPFTRGISASTSKKGTAQLVYTGRATPEESNAQFKAIIGAGADGVTIAFDLATQLGYDPDNPKAAGEVGRTGVSLSSLRDWEIAFDGVELQNIGVGIVQNAAAIVAMASFFALAKQKGVPLSSLRGYCQNDVLKEYTTRGNYIYSPSHSIRLGIDTLAYCVERAPQFHPVQACTAHFAHSGATPPHEVAVGLANCIAYFDAAVERQINIDDIAPGVEWLLACEYYGFFEQLAKIRAMRKIYAGLLKERYGAKKPESLMLRFRAVQGGMYLTRQQYLTNIARTALAGLVAVLGGSQQLSLRAYDEQFGLPSDEADAYRIRVGHLINYETGVSKVIDPLAGSYFLESLTLEMEKKIDSELNTILEKGGAVKCLENGYIPSLLARDGFNWVKDRQTGKVPWIGVNMFASDEEEKPVRVYRANPAIEKQRIEAVQEVRRKRDNVRVKKALSDLKAMAQLPARKENNLMPAVIEATEAYATIGEICDALREVWGEFQEIGQRVF